MASGRSRARRGLRCAALWRRGRERRAVRGEPDCGAGWRRNWDGNISSRQFPKWKRSSAGLSKGRFDAAIGAITITPEREARVDFSYPAHRSGVAVALRKETGPLAAISSYLTVAMDLGNLILGILALLLLLAAAIWLVERPRRSGTKPHERTW